MERSNVVATRVSFLRKRHDLKQSHHNVVYLDETWLNQNYTVGKCWIDTTSPPATGAQPPKGKRRCLIILHAGSREGFVNNAKLVFRAKKHKTHNSHNSRGHAVTTSPQKITLLLHTKLHALTSHTPPSFEMKKMVTPASEEDTINTPKSDSYLSIDNRYCYECLYMGWRVGVCMCLYM